MVRNSELWSELFGVGSGSTVSWLRYEFESMFVVRHGVLIAGEKDADVTFICCASGTKMLVEFLRQYAGRKKAVSHVSSPSSSSKACNDTPLPRCVVYTHFFFDAIDAVDKVALFIHLQRVAMNCINYRVIDPARQRYLSLIVLIAGCAPCSDVRQWIGWLLPSLSMVFMGHGTAVKRVGVR